MNTSKKIDKQNEQSSITDKKIVNEQEKMKNQSNSQNLSASQNSSVATQISKTAFEKILKDFEQSWGYGTETTETIDNAFVKATEARGDNVLHSLSRVNFDMPIGTLIKIDLGAENSAERKTWNLSHRPEKLKEGDILLYSGWFLRRVNITTETEMRVGKGDVNNTPSNDVIDDDLTAAFSSKIQLFLLGGKEEIWTGLIPDFFYATLVQGGGGICDKPLFVQDHGLTLNQGLIEKITKQAKTRELQLGSNLPLKIAPDAHNPQLRETVKQKYDSECQKANKEALERHNQAHRTEIQKLAKSLK